MSDFFKNIQDKIKNENEEATRNANLENEERREKEQIMASTLSKMNQDEILTDDEIARVSASGIETKPILKEMEPLTDAVKEVIKDQASRLMGKAQSSITVLQTKKPEPIPPSLSDQKINLDGEALAERISSQYWD